MRTFKSIDLDFILLKLRPYPHYTIENAESCSAKREEKKEENGKPKEETKKDLDKFRCKFSVKSLLNGTGQSNLTLKSFQ